MTMKRSEINRHQKAALALFADYRFALPPFALWGEQAWRADLDTAAYCRAHQMGWDITDFGSGDFERQGLVVFCVRNGRQSQADSRPYAEKLLIVGAGFVGSAMVNDIRRNPHAGLTVVGLVDDDPHKIGCSISGVSVLGSCEDIQRICEAQGVERLEQFATLLPYRALMLQGYLFSRPVSADELLRLLGTLPAHCQELFQQSQKLPALLGRGNDKRRGLFVIGD
jgi:hypothetical protein